MADTFHRLLRILAMIPRAPKWIDVDTIAKNLAAEDLEPEKRTLQRDLLKLERMGLGLELVNPDERPYQWRFSPTASTLFLPGLDPQAALALRLVELHMERLVPKSTMRALQPALQAARAALEGKPVARWLDRVRMTSRSQALLPPKVDGAVVSAVHEALLEGRQLKARYKKPSADEPTEFILHPLGLAYRDWSGSLVATAWDFQDPRVYPLHRFAAAEVLPAKAVAKGDFNLDEYIASGALGFPVGADIDVALLFDERPGALIQETPLAADQRVTVHTDRRVLVQARVPDTIVLRAWILGHGPTVEVKKPAALRKAIAEQHRKAAARYRRDA